MLTATEELLQCLAYRGHCAGWRLINMNNDLSIDAKSK